MGLNSVNFMRPWKAAKFGKIAQINGRYAVQDHSRSSILKLMESPYAISY